MSISSDTIESLRAVLRLGPSDQATAQYLEACADILSKRKAANKEDAAGAALDGLPGVLAKVAAALRSLDGELESIAPGKTAGAKSATRKTAAKTTKTRKTKAEKFPPPTTSEGWAGDVISAKMFVDGGSKGNPGPAGGGIVFLTMTGEPLHEDFIAFDEDQTNNAAEYKTLIRGVEIAIQKGVKNLFVFSDSELVVKQIGGQYKIKNAALAPLAARVQIMRRQFTQFELTAVPRAKNARADELANYAILQLKGESAS